MYYRRWIILMLYAHISRRGSAYEYIQADEPISTHIHGHSCINPAPSGWYLGCEAGYHGRSLKEVAQLTSWQIDKPINTKHGVLGSRQIQRKSGAVVVFFPMNAQMKFYIQFFFLLLTLCNFATRFNRTRLHPPIWRTVQPQFGMGIC